MQRHHLMEGSTFSSMNMPLCSTGEDVAPPSEESGWTSYFEEFMASEKKEAKASSCSSCVGGGSSSPSYSSLVSDAASCAPAMGAGTFKMLRFKKRKTTRGYFDDDSLEDTASSPVSSPKVGNLGKLDVDYKKKDGDGHISEAKGFVSADHLELRTKKMHGMGFVERATHEVIELKAKELCLVPLSMLVDYLDDGSCPVKYIK